MTITFDMVRGQNLAELVTFIQSEENRPSKKDIYKGDEEHRVISLREVVPSDKIPGTHRVTLDVTEKDHQKETTGPEHLVKVYTIVTKEHHKNS